jgi:hypothetical protein
MNIRILESVDGMSQGRIYNVPDTVAADLILKDYAEPVLGKREDHLKRDSGPRNDKRLRPNMQDK